MQRSGAGGAPAAAGGAPAAVSAHRGAAGGAPAAVGTARTRVRVAPGVPLGRMVTDVVEASGAELDDAGKGADDGELPDIRAGIARLRAHVDKVCACRSPQCAVTTALAGEDAVSPVMYGSRASAAQRETINALLARMDACAERARAE